MDDPIKPNMRRQFLKTAAAACTHLLIPGNVKAFAKKETLRLGYLPITDATPLLVAHGLGIFFPGRACS